MFVSPGNSHLDHGLMAEHLDFIIERFGKKNGFFAETVLMPESLPALECGLHGPLMGDGRISDDEAEMVTRDGRKWPSRMCSRPKRKTHWLTVIAGPFQGEKCVLYTAYGGKQAPREPGDPSMTDEQRAEAIVFWSQHALSKEA
jgi:hypothetical protein